MATGLETPNETSTVALLKGIVADVEDLIAQQLSVARAEIKADVQKTAEAGLFLILGGGGCLVAAVLWSFALAHLIYWAILPAATEAPALPLWGCYAIVAFVMTVIGAGFLYAGHEKISEVQMFPKETAEAVKDNVNWKTGQRLH
jgi:hypothetical protein